MADVDEADPDIQEMKLSAFMPSLPPLCQTRLSLRRNVWLSSLLPVPFTLMPFQKSSLACSRHPPLPPWLLSHPKRFCCA